MWNSFTSPGQLVERICRGRRKLHGNLPQRRSSLGRYTTRSPTRTTMQHSTIPSTRAQKKINREHLLRRTRSSSLLALILRNGHQRGASPMLQTVSGQEQRKPSRKARFVPRFPRLCLRVDLGQQNPAVPRCVVLLHHPHLPRAARVHARPVSFRKAISRASGNAVQHRLRLCGAYLVLLTTSLARCLPRPRRSGK